MARPKASPDKDGSWWINVTDDKGDPEKFGPFSSQDEAENVFDLLFAPVT